jgi:hypothetical protein
MILSDKDLHIISFNIPYPADYGGVIDVFYKLKALAEQGVRVHLHCYQYGRQESKMLETVCHKVYYYRRKIYKDPIFTRQPYIVATRNTTEILQNLLKDDYPILFEGLHCCYYLSHPDLRDRVKIVRMHNIEHVYYRSLARIERNIFKKYFFYAEAERLATFERVLANAEKVAAISPDDLQTLSKRYGNVFYLPVFHAHEQVNISSGKGEFAFYHGNLGVGENNEAALYLVREVFKSLDYPLIIAGMNPSKELKKAVEECENVNLLSKAGTSEINSLMQEAHINILPTFQSTGMKLKLINVLFQGRHCIVNDKMVHNTGLGPMCHIANSPSDIRKKIAKLRNVAFTQKEIDQRASYMGRHFNNGENASKLLEQIFSVKFV